MKKNNINNSYTRFYERNKQDLKVYPTEFVVRIFKANYPNLDFDIEKGSKVLDLGFGDGRNTAFLIEQGYDTFGIEITNDIVMLVKERLDGLNLKYKDLKVGRNNEIPFEDNFFDAILGCHVSYYLDDDTTFDDNLKEFARVLKPGGWFISSFITTETYMMPGATSLDEDYHYVVWSDPYQNRNGHKFVAFENFNQIEEIFSNDFKRFSFASAFNNYFGIDERLFWVVCQKK